MARIGQGGMGTVWRARDEVLGRQVAVKRLHVSPQLQPDELAMRYERTTREAQAAARINHPNVVGVHDVVDDEGLPCIVMEYVPSATLGDAIKAAARADRSVLPREAARIGRGMIAALRAAHSAGVLHRDVKPGNVLLGDDGRVVLTDFGIAVASGTSTLTKTGELVGSIDYLAPERVKGGTPGPASDLWALGATLYQAVEGRPPFRKNTAVETAYAIAMDPLEPPLKAGSLAPLIEALLAKEPADRPTAEVVEQALRAAEAEADTALMGWPTLALGTVARGRPEQPTAPETATRPVPHPDTQRTAPDAVTHTGMAAGTGAGAGREAATGTGTAAATGAVTAPTAVTAGNAAGVATADRTDAPPAAPPPGKRRGRRVAIWGVVGVLAAGSGAGAVWYTMHRDGSDVSNGAANGKGTGDNGSGKATPSPSGGPRNSVGPPPPLPSGYRLAKEPELGISFPVPDGWRREVKDSGRQVTYSSDAEVAELRINVLDFATADQVQHFKEVEADFKENYPAYKRLRLQDTVFQGDAAAIWEFTFQGRSREYRAIDLGFGREGGKEYAIYVSAPSATWKRSEEVFSQVKDGFRKTEPTS
ncbi:serine/threonine-protein kinase [Streptomyces celluloflavus]|uniref:serine/threonine-protein kinase n=1 Tax=Streptomyces celluloflavus TaxID=58344 RepID=UPI0036B96646